MFFKVSDNLNSNLALTPPPGGGYCHIWAVKGMVFKQFTQG